jgi:hypothetical protein
MLRRAIAVLFALHGVAHTVGFMSAWRLGEFTDAPYSTLVLNGAMDVGDAGIRVVGLAWLVAAAAFLWAGVAVWQGRPSASRTTAVVTAGSLALCFLGLPAAFVGVGLDLGILAALAVARGVRPAELRGAIP